MKNVLLIIAFVGLFTFSGFTQTVTIGNEIWSTKNLDVTTFRNGEQIPEAKTEEEWQKANENKEPAWCYYKNNSAYGDKYGKLYNWYAVNDKRGLAPKGWKIPDVGHWQLMINAIGGNNNAGSKLKSKEWSGLNGSVTNSTGFTALPGGARNESGSFNGAGSVGLWWSKEESYIDDTVFAWDMTLNNNQFKNKLYPKSYGFSVRLIKE